MYNICIGDGKEVKKHHNGSRVDEDSRIASVICKIKLCNNTGIE